MYDSPKLRRHLSKHIKKGYKRLAFEKIMSAIETAREYKHPSKFDYSKNTIKKIINKGSVGRYPKKKQATILISAIRIAYLQWGLSENIQLSGTDEGIKTPFEKFAMPILIEEGFKDAKPLLRAHSKLIKNT
jgi:hypothetical protein